MNDKNLMTPEERAMAEMLEKAAGEMNVSPSFKTELEKKLMNAHQPKSGRGLFSFKKIVSTAGWAIGWALLILMFIWVARTLAPQPQPAAGNTPFPSVETATPEPLPPESTLPKGEAFNWNGTTLYLNAPLPEIPAEAKIYITRDEVFATVDDVNALAQRFGMNGEIYQMTGDTGNTTDYLAVDGNQQLRVRSDRYFTYFPDTAGKVSTGVYNDNPNAEALINEFMQSHGFNFQYRIERSQIYGAYIVLPLTPDGFALHHEHLNFSGIRFYFNKDSIEYVDASLLKYDEVAAASIISAQEAFDKLLDPVAGNGAGVLMGMASGSAPEEESWRRIFPLDQTITYFGYMNSTGKSVTGGAPLVTLDGYTVTGNTEGTTENMQNIFVEVTGQFHDVDGFKTFEIQSWKIHEGYDEGYVGTIQREGEQVVLNTIEGDKLIIPDMPSDIALPFENVYIMGVTQGDTFEWKSFDTRMAHGGGGGGGGGGQGFYKLNLSGTPVQLPTPEPTPNSINNDEITYPYIVVEGDTLATIANAFGVGLEDLLRVNGISEDALYIGQTILIPQVGSSAPQKIEGLRGILTVTIYNQADGDQRIEYGFIPNDPDSPLMLLEGDNLQELQNYHNRPIEIWGTIDHINEYGLTVAKVEKFEVPFPDLQFQILRGTQTISAFGNVQDIVLFTTDDNKTYIELAPNGLYSSGITGNQGDEILVEALILPDETYGGYPAMRVFSSTLAVDENGQPVELTVTADQPYVGDESVPLDQSLIPTATIEKVELVYYMPDPHFLTTELTMDQRYLQPAWLFRGHYSSGDEFEYLVQALKDEFLLPELAPYTQPG